MVKSAVLLSVRENAVCCAGAGGRCQFCWSTVATLCGHPAPGTLWPRCPRPRHQFLLKSTERLCVGDGQVCQPDREQDTPGGSNRVRKTCQNSGPVFRLWICLCASSYTSSPTQSQHGRLLAVYSCLSPRPFLIRNRLHLVMEG